MATPDYDYDLQQASLTRRQKLLDSMTSGALAPMEMQTAPGGIVPQMGVGNVLMKLAQAYMTKRGQDNLKTEQGALTKRYSDELTQGMKNFYDTSNGYTRTTQLQGPNEDGTAQSGLFQEQVPGDRKKAIFDALAANHPVLRDLAMKELTAEDKNRLTPKDILSLSDFDPKSRLDALTKGVGSLKGKKDVKEAGGSFYDVSGEAPQYLGGAEYAPPFKIDGDVYQNEKHSGQIKKLDNAPKVTIGGTQVAVDAGKKAGMVEYFKKAAEQVDALGKVSLSAQNNLQAIADLKDLDAKGMYSNATAPFATFAQNLSQAFGIPVDTGKLANSENYNSIATDLWQGIVSKYGGNRGVTKEEAAALREIVPQAAQSPQARQQMYSILENAAKRQMAQYQGANKALARAVKADDPEMFANEFGDIYNPMPNTPGASLPAPGASQKPVVKRW